MEYEKAYQNSSDEKKEIDNTIDHIYGGKHILFNFIHIRNKKKRNTFDYLVSWNINQ